MKEEGPDELRQHAPPEPLRQRRALPVQPAAREGGRGGCARTIASAPASAASTPRGSPASGTSDKVGTGAWMQDDERVVAVRYGTPLAALANPANGQPLLTNEHLLDRGGLSDAWGESLVGRHPAADDRDLAAALRRPRQRQGGARHRRAGRRRQGAAHPLAAVGDDGRHRHQARLPRRDDHRRRRHLLVRLHREPALGPARCCRTSRCAPSSRPAPTRTLQPEEKQEISATVRLQNRVMRVNIALLGRGTVRGVAIYGDDPRARARRHRAAPPARCSTSSAASRSAADGTFSVPGVPVGPITLVVRDREGRVGYATVGVDRPGAIVDAVVEVPRFVVGKGTVTGVVVGATDGEPIAGARVAVYSQGRRSRRAGDRRPRPLPLRGRARGAGVAAGRQLGGLACLRVHRPDAGGGRDERGDAAAAAGREPHRHRHRPLPRPDHQHATYRSRARWPSSKAPASSPTPTLSAATASRACRCRAPTSATASRPSTSRASLQGTVAAAAHPRRLARRRSRRRRSCCSR